MPMFFAAPARRAAPSAHGHGFVPLITVLAVFDLAIWSHVVTVYTTNLAAAPQRLVVASSLSVPQPLPAKP
jgi:hypothetical protein